MSLAELNARIGRADDDRRSCSTCARSDAFDAGHVPGARTCRAGSSSCASTTSCRTRRARIVTVCEFGKISTLAAATLRDLGFLRAAALDGGMKAWREGGFPVETARRGVSARAR